MTQQTTVERIETILRRDLDVDVIVSRGGDPHYNEPDIVGVNVAAQTIAAEIDALTRERDKARVDAVQEMIETYKGNAADHEAKIAALQAEAERLRPAAEAWEASETLRALLRAPGRVNAEAEEEHRQELHAADRVFQAAANRARAAKESQP